MNRRVLIAIAVLLVLGIGGFTISQRMRAAKSAAGLTQYKVAKAQTGEVRKTVSSSGVLQAWNVVDIKARASGELTLLAVDVGSEVKKGQILARIDPLDVQLALNTATADEISARAREQQSDKQYHLQVAQSHISIEDARANLLSAQASAQQARARLATAKKMSGAQPELTRSAIANADASYQQALKQRALLDATNAQQRASAQSTYDQALANRKNAAQSLERQQALVAKGFVSKQAVDTAQANLAVIDAQVEAAKAKLDTQEAELKANVEAANARVDQTRAALQSARANNIDIANKLNAVHEAEAAVRQADAQVLKARVALEQSVANQANNQIKQYDVQTAAASIERAKATRITAKTTLDRTVIRAPKDGVILQKYVEQGTIITSAISLSSAGTSIVQLGDIAKMYVDVTVDETDIANVDEGQTVDVTVEAYPGVPFTGKVSRVDPQAVVLQNVTSVHVRVEVDNSAPTFRLLKPGMNATCQFVINRKQNVVNVPNEALHEDDNGRFVEVAVGGHPAPADPQAGTPADPDTLVEITRKRVPVEVGVEGNDAVEIVSGIKPGDRVITQTIEPVTATASQGSPFGGGGLGRGGGGFGGGGGRGGGGGGGGGRGGGGGGR